MAFRQLFAIVSAASLVVATAVAGPLEPGDADHLQRALEDYERLAAEGEWPTLSGPMRLKAGGVGPEVAILRRRLERSHDFDRSQHSNAASNRFDADLVAAVRRFQARHGLKADGVVGAQTLAALNVSVKTRVEQLRANLDRARRSPSIANGRAIVVNIPDYTLRVFDQGRPVLSMRVIVGTEFKPTPVFSDTMTYLVFRPYWNIPESIAREEVVPRIRRDRKVVGKEGFEAYVPAGDSVRVVPLRDVDWSAFDSSGYRLRQRPGPRNPLGLVKFMLPNEHDVYLHDTASDAQFGVSERTLSHGCVRVEKPLELAELVLQDKPGWNPARIQAAMRNGDNQLVGLAHPVPVHIVYRTAWVEPDGRVAFRDDIYDHDEQARAA